MEIETFLKTYEIDVVFRSESDILIAFGPIVETFFLRRNSIVLYIHFCILIIDLNK